jgi:acyl carrier protein
MAFTVSLNGNNYISDKRKDAFEKALEDDTKVKLGGNGQKPPVPEAQTTVVNTQPNPAISPTAPVQPQPAHDYSRLFESLELGLAQSYGHQSETLRVHEQYLHNQAEYATIFSQLMQQQGTLFSNGNTSPEQSEVTLTVLKSLARSIEQFHQHQTETLNVHNQFLNQQSSYAQEFVQLLRQQYNGSNGGNSGNGGNGNRKEYKPAVLTTAYEMPVLRVPEQIKPVRTQGGPAVPELAPIFQPAVKANQPSVVSIEPATTPKRDNAIDSGVLTQMLLSIVSDKTGYPVEMLELDMDMEADLGIDSIKRVEIMGSLQDQVPDMPDVDAEALAELRTLAQIIAYIKQNDEKTGAKDRELQSDDSEISLVTPEPKTPVPTENLESTELNTALLEIVSDKTGYPAEMLELDMDMEADLGIDSIKRVEILGALQDIYPGMPEIDADTLSDLRTLQQIIGYIDGQEHTEKKV